MLELSLTFTPGETEMIVPVDTVLDSESEGLEQFRGVLTSPTAGTSIGQETATVDITGA